MFKQWLNHIQLFVHLYIYMGFILINCKVFLTYFLPCCILVAKDWSIIDQYSNDDIIYDSSAIRCGILGAIYGYKRQYSHFPEMGLFYGWFYSPLWVICESFSLYRIYSHIIFSQIQHPHYTSNQPHDVCCLIFVEFVQN